MIRFSALVLALACGLTACTGDKPSTAGPTSRPSPGLPSSAMSPPAAPSPAAGVLDVSCDAVIGLADGVGQREVVLDLVALPTRRVLEAVPTDPQRPGWLFAKDGLLVRARTPAEISLPAEVAGRALLTWANAGRWGTRVRVPACPYDAVWLVWAGGYVVNAPMCLPVTVRAGGREQRVRIPVGVPCEPSA